MKKIFLTCAVVALSIFAVEAQTAQKSKKAKKSTVSKASKAKAERERLAFEKQQEIEEQRLERIRIDSSRMAKDSVDKSLFEQDRMAWKERRLFEVDSINKEKWTAQIAEKEQRSKIDRERDLLNKAAKLDANQGRQVKMINQVYHEKAKAVRQDSLLTDTQKKEQLTSLNKERRARITTVIGKSKEKKLEKERKEMVKKNTIDAEAAWINEVEGYAKN